MSYKELDRAMHVALRPLNTTGRSKYGMGLKTAACWIGNLWTVRTKKLHETTEHSVTVDVNRVASGRGDLPYKAIPGKDKNLHYSTFAVT
jgi:hypothetical protein